MSYRSSFTLIPQLFILFLFWILGEAVSRLVRIPLPGGIIGMFLLLAALKLGFVKVSAVERGSHLLLTEMLLFFVPAVLVVLDHREFLGSMGLKILGVIMASTVLVMISTGLTIEILSTKDREDADNG